MTSEGKSVWSLALEGNLPPCVFARGEHLLAIDDRAVHVLDQEGKQLRSYPFASPRRGPALALCGGALVVVPTASAVIAFHDEGGGAYQAAPLSAGALLAASDGDDLALLGEHALQLQHGAGGTLSGRWSLPLALPAGGTVILLGFHGGVISYYEPGRRLLHLVQAADHRELHRLRLGDGLSCIPLILPDKVVIADSRGGLSAFPLMSPAASAGGAR